MMKLRHPNLVSLVGVITKEEPHALVMEFLCGGSMLDWLRVGDGRAHTDLLFVLHQVASGMCELARQGIGEER